MADSFHDGCYNPKRATSGQLLSYCKKISANTQHLLFDVLHLHFYSTKKSYHIGQPLSINYMELTYQIVYHKFSQTTIIKLNTIYNIPKINLLEITIYLTLENCPPLHVFLLFYRLVFRIQSSHHADVLLHPS